MKIEVGNLNDLATAGTGWVLGFSSWTRETLRYVNQSTPVVGLCMKWMHHEANDPRGVDKPISEGRTLSVLVGSGPFVQEFARDEAFSEDFRRIVMKRSGDFVAWGPGVYHRWFAPAASTIMTLRWDPAAVPSAGSSAVPPAVR